MMNKKGRSYKRALELYYKGEIEKAIKECENGIAAKPEETSSFLNLKGLLFYFKGNLPEAKKYWEINAKNNNDEVAKKYLQDSKNDVEKEAKYKEAVSAFEKMEINEAIEVLNECKSSDFNCINVNVKLAECYMKKGEHEKVIEHVNQVLSIDKYNVQADSLKKELINLGIIKKEVNYRIAGTVASIIVGVGLVSVLGMSMVNMLDLNPVTGKPVEVADKENTSTTDSNKDKNDNKDNDKEENNKDEDDKDSGKEEETSKDESNKGEFPADEIKDSIDSKDYEKLADYIATWKDEDLTENEQGVYDTALLIMKQDGLPAIYEKGYENYESENYIQAIEEFEKVNKMEMIDHPLNQSNLFYLATSYDKAGDEEHALEMFEEFVDTYEDSDYRPEIVYNLANKFDKENDNTKAKKYANIIKNDYPSSMYNNTIIEEILNSN